MCAVAIEKAGERNLVGFRLGAELVDAQSSLIALDNLEVGLVGNRSPQSALLGAEIAIAGDHPLQLWYRGFVDKGAAVAIAPICLALRLLGLRHDYAAFQSELKEIDRQQQLQLKKAERALRVTRNGRSGSKAPSLIYMRPGHDMGGPARSDGAGRTRTKSSQPQHRSCSQAWDAAWIL